MTILVTCLASLLTARKDVPLHDFHPLGTASHLILFSTLNPPYCNTKLDSELALLLQLCCGWQLSWLLVACACLGVFHLRRLARRRFGLPPSCHGAGPDPAGCGAAVEDLCLSCWPCCSPCALAQASRISTLLYLYPSISLLYLTICILFLFFHFDFQSHDLK